MSITFNDDFIRRGKEHPEKELTNGKRFMRSQVEQKTETEYEKES